MTIQVYTSDKEQEKALLSFLESGHYNYQSTSEKDLADVEFINQYNKELDEAEAEIDSGVFFTQEQVKKHFSERRKRVNGN